jgi:hypothetical protein
MGAFKLSYRWPIVGGGHRARRAAPACLSGRQVVSTTDGISYISNLFLLHRLVLFSEIFIMMRLTAVIC